MSNKVKYNEKTGKCEYDGTDDAIGAFLFVLFVLGIIVYAFCTGFDGWTSRMPWG